MKFINKLIKIFNTKTPDSYNVLTQLPYEFQKNTLLVELVILAYSQEQALELANKIVSEFNQTEDAKYKIDKIWKIKMPKLVFTKNKLEISLKQVVKNSPNLALSTEELYSLSKSLAFKILLGNFEFVMVNDFPKTYKNGPSIN